MMINNILRLKAPPVCVDTLVSSGHHVLDSPLNHGWVQSPHLPPDAVLQLVQSGWSWSVNLMVNL